MSSTDPLAQVERAQLVFERGPQTAVAAFFAIAFFVAIWFLLRTKDRSLAQLAESNAAHAKEISRLHAEHAAQVERLNADRMTDARRSEKAALAFLKFAEKAEGRRPKSPVELAARVEGGAK